MKVAVSGLGCISAIGNDVDSNRKSLVNQLDGITHSAVLDSRFASLKMFGEVKFSNAELKEIAKLNLNGLSRTDLLAFIAFAEAVKSAGLTNSQVSSYDTAFISASTVGGLYHTQEIFDDANLQSKSPDFLDSYSYSAHTRKIAAHYKIKGFSDTINTACSSSANAIMLGMRLIRSGRAKRAIVGGADSLSKYTVNGFNSLQILSDKKCTPFDKNRDGLNLGEAAAFLVLEAENLCIDKQILGYVAGAGNSNDAFHASSMTEEATGVIKSMKWALEDAGINSSQIDYINAHGTGTQNNDLVEFLGFQKFFENIPPFSSTKTFTGHTLGAAGALEAVFSILSLVNQELYPNLHSIDFLDNSGNSIITKYQKNSELKNIMSNSYGFGGNCTSLIISR